jgi:hypothetical protein
MRGTAHEYVWLDRAPHTKPATAAVTAATVAAAPDSDLGERDGADREAVPGQEAAGGPAEPGGHCKDVTAWCVMDFRSEVRIYGLEITCARQLIAQRTDSASNTGFVVNHCMHN